MKGNDWDMVGSAGSIGASGTGALSSDMRSTVLLFANGVTKADVVVAEAMRMTVESFIVVVDAGFSFHD